MPIRGTEGSKYIGVALQAITKDSATQDFVVQRVANERFANKRGATSIDSYKAIINHTASWKKGGSLSREQQVAIEKLAIKELLDSGESECVLSNLSRLHRRSVVSYKEVLIQELLKEGGNVEELLKNWEVLRGYAPMPKEVSEKAVQVILKEGRSDLLLSYWPLLKEGLSSEGQNLAANSVLTALRGGDHSTSPPMVAEAQTAGIATPPDARSRNSSPIDTEIEEDGVTESFSLSTNSLDDASFTATSESDRSEVRLGASLNTLEDSSGESFLTGVSYTRVSDEVNWDIESSDSDNELSEMRTPSSLTEQSSSDGISEEDFASMNDSQQVDAVVAELIELCEEEKILERWDLLSAGVRWSACGELKELIYDKIAAVLQEQKADDSAPIPRDLVRILAFEDKEGQTFFSGMRKSDKLFSMICSLRFESTSPEMLEHLQREASSDEYDWMCCSLFNIEQGALLYEVPDSWSIEGKQVAKIGLAFQQLKKLEEAYAKRHALCEAALRAVQKGCPDNKAVSEAIAIAEELRVGSDLTITAAKDDYMTVSGLEGFIEAMQKRLDLQAAYAHCFYRFKDELEDSLRGAPPQVLQQAQYLCEPLYCPELYHRYVEDAWMAMPEGEDKKNMGQLKSFLGSGVLIVETLTQVRAPDTHY